MERELSEMADFLQARLDEDESAAREAAGLTENWVADRPALGVVLVDGEPLIEGHITGLTEHIARHDPARVLREVKAKRAIVAMHRLVFEDYRDGDGMERSSADCAKCGTDGRYTSDTYPCNTLRQIAAVYSDHPSYREEWKP